MGVDLMPLLFEAPEQGAKDGEEKEKEKQNGMDINKMQLSQACIFVFQCAMVVRLDAVGVRLNALVSHSLGEVAASGAFHFTQFQSQYLRTLDFLAL